MMAGAGRERETVVLVFPSGNQNVRSNLRALEREEMLAEFCTTVAWRGGRQLLARLPRILREHLAARVFDEIDGRRIRTFPLREIVNRIAARTGLPYVARHEHGWASMDGVSRALDASVARLIRRGKLRADAVYAYEYAAMRSFEAAAAAGMRRFYELPIGYWRAGLRILGEESERNPEWAPTLELLKDSAGKQAWKDRELVLAEHVIVPSDFVAETLREHPGFSATVDVVPYGAPVPRPSVVRDRPEKLRLLFVGHLSQRKGISYLFAAMRALEGVATLTLVGPRVGGDCPALSTELARHRWLGTVPHRRVLEIMAEHDVFVFPSLFEGLAQVLLEAMAQGLPAITTRNSGGAMVVEEGENGFLVPIRDPQAIAERVALLARRRELLESMSVAALRKAACMSWRAREEVFIDLLRRRLAASCR